MIRTVFFNKLIEYLIIKSTELSQRIKIADNHILYICLVRSYKPAELVPCSLIYSIADTFDNIRFKGSNRARGLRQCTSDIRRQTVFKHDLISESAVNVTNKFLRILVRSELTICYHFFISLHPSHIRCDKLADKLLIIKFLMPIGNKAPLKLVKRNKTCICCRILLNSGTQTKSPCPVIEESCMVSCILHIIRESKCFFIIIELR